MTALLLAGAVVLSTVAAGAVVGAGHSDDLGASATVDATPSDPSEAESTHTVVVPLGSAAESPGSPLDDVVVDYTAGTPTADVSNVGAGTIERFGIDRDGDSPGTRVDVQANVTAVTGEKDGSAVRIATDGGLTLREGDEVVVVLRPVQNPQTAGSAEVAVTVNSRGANDTATGTVAYEHTDASVSFADQSTAGVTVTLASVTLSEGGFVAIQNASGARADEIRGHSGYLSAGTHEDVTVRLDTPVERNRDLVAQAYTDANGDLWFQYDIGGGEEDFPYRTRDGNLMGTDAARMRYAAASATATTTVTPSDGNGAHASATPTGSANVGTSPATDRAGAPPSATTTPTDEGATSTTASAATPTPGADRTSNTTADATRTGGQPGFGVPLALLALAGATLLARRAA